MRKENCNGRLSLFSSEGKLMEIKRVNALEKESR